VKRLDPRLLRHARATRVHVAVCVALGLIGAGLAIAQARLLADAIGGAVQDGAGLPALGGVLGSLAAVLAGRAALAWAQESAAHRASASVKSDLRLALLRRAVDLGPRWSAGARSGEVVALATRGVDALDGYFARYLPQLVLAVVLPVVVVLAILPADAVAAVTVALTLPLIVVFMALVGLASEAQRRGRWRALARLSHHFLDVVAGLPTLKVFGRARAQIATLERVTDEYRRESMRALRVAFLSAFVLELFATLSVALVAVGIGLRLVAGELDLRTGLFVLVLAPEAYLPLRQLGTHYHASEEGLAAAEAAFAIIEAPQPPAGQRSDVPDLRTGELRVDGVSVRQPDRGLIAPSGVSLAVRPGEVVAVAGPSGSGKTTLLQVILGLVPADEGEVVVASARVTGDGVTGDDVTGGGVTVPIRDLDPGTWRRQVAWVPQDPLLFAGSVADNVRLAAPEAPDDAVREALALVGLGNLDLETTLGEGGSGLSSGERRRVAIARAIVRDAPLLLLDEPTAGLDEASERLVLGALRDLARTRRRAVIVVAHRPAALALADRVVRVAARLEAAA
jgi:thiol reductant ABC exporter CydD subunit